MSQAISSKPRVLITGAAGDLGSALSRALADKYSVVGLDQPGKTAAVPLIAVDLSSEDSVSEALAQFCERFGSRIASVVHLAAYFDFTGEAHPLYRKVNIEGTRNLLRALQSLEVEQFVYASTMLVHEADEPGERIDETQPIAPKWAYPRSKAAAEEVIRWERGRIPVAILRLAGVYDERTSVPTLARQIARIYERDFKSYLYSGDVRAGQAMLHKEDMTAAFRLVIDRRRELPPEALILIGEPDAIGYDDLQDRLGSLIHGEADWHTFNIPKPAAKAGAWLEGKLEPLIPDAIDQGEKPFIRPFMIDMADDHYALDVSRARELLGWQPKHRIRDELPAMVQSLKDDPHRWYRENRIPSPAWIAAAHREGESPEELRVRYESGFRDQYRRHLWTHFANMALGTWLITSPPLLGLESRALAFSDVLSGVLLILFATLALSWRFAWARWVCAVIGSWVMTAPILFWAPTAAGYLNDTIVGALIVAFAVALPPEPGVARVAATSGPAVPPGWSYNPSAWSQRIPIIALAFVGLYISRYLAAYQLGHIEEVWDPFFAGGPDPKNGTEEIITSSVSRAWPVSDAAVGALTYLFEILTGAIGSRRRWRTMPWLVLLFGLMIAPLGVVSIFFIIIQPIWIGTWCTLCLIAAAAMIVQIPYSLDELVATSQFLARRRRAGQSLLRVFFQGDTDAGNGDDRSPPEFERPPRQVIREMLKGGVSLPWNLVLCILIGVWLMLTRLTLDTQGSMANADHVIGALVITFTAIACAEVARTVRFVNMAFGAALLVTPFFYEATIPQTIGSLVCGTALIALSLRRGPIRQRVGGWNRSIV